VVRFIQESVSKSGKKYAMVAELVTSNEVDGVQAQGTGMVGFVEVSPESDLSKWEKGKEVAWAVRSVGIIEGTDLHKLVVA
jgi:hypothetical protein